MYPANNQYRERFTMHPAGSRQRPLSPHLQIYKPQITSVLSAFHRLTGIGLAAGMVYLVGWFGSAVMGPTWFDCYVGMTTSVLGAIVLFGITVAFMFHACNGVRHLAWDAGWGYELGTVSVTGWLVVVLAVVLSVGLWWTAVG